MVQASNNALAIANNQGSNVLQPASLTDNDS